MNITSRRTLWYTISLSAVVLSWVFILGLGFNFGLDFTGGARWDVRFQSAVNREQLNDFFAQQSVITQNVKIQTSEENTFLINLQSLPEETQTQLSQALKTSLGDFDVVSFRKIDATISSHFAKKSIQAIGLCLLAITIFVAFAFRKVPKSINPWRFGIVAIVALFHDISIVAGVFALLGRLNGTEIDLQFVTALLATLGFSVNDTIVILDRVRDNIQVQRAHETFEDTVEKSIQETLLRSLYTSFSTILPLLSLIFFGADSIFPFVFALALGVFVGTYSSIFVAAPLLVTWKHWADRR